MKLPCLLAERYLAMREVPGTPRGEVIVAEDTTLGRLVEITVLASDRAADPFRRARFSAAARAAASLSVHPGLLTVYDCGELDGRPYLVSERRRGPSLARLVCLGQRLSASRAARIGAEAADALSVAHLGGLVHGNVNPGSLVLRPGDHPVLSDFGLGDGLTQARDVVDLALTLLACLDEAPEHPSGEGAQLRAVLEPLAFSSSASQPEEALALARACRRSGRRRPAPAGAASSMSRRLSRCGSSIPPPQPMTLRSWQRR